MNGKQALRCFWPRWGRAARWAPFAPLVNTPRSPLVVPERDLFWSRNDAQRGKPPFLHPQQTDQTPLAVLCPCMPLSHTPQPPHSGLCERAGWPDPLTQQWKRHAQCGSLLWCGSLGFWSSTPSGPREQQRAAATLSAHGAQGRKRVFPPKAMHALFRHGSGACARVRERGFRAGTAADPRVASGLDPYRFPLAKQLLPLSCPRSRPPALAPVLSHDEPVCCARPVCGRWGAGTGAKACRR